MNADSARNRDLGFMLCSRSAVERAEERLSHGPILPSGNRMARSQVAYNSAIFSSNKETQSPTRFLAPNLAARFL